MAHEIPNRIELRVLADSRPIEGILCMVISGTDYRNSFSLVAGPSDASGKLHVTREAILASGGERLRLAQDGKTSLEPAASNFTIVPMDLARLKSAKHAARSLDPSYRFPAGYAESVENAISVLSRHPASRLTVEVLSVDGDCQVRTRSVDPL